MSDDATERPPLWPPAGDSTVTFLLSMLLTFLIVAGLVGLLMVIL